MYLVGSITVLFLIDVKLAAAGFAATLPLLIVVVDDLPRPLGARVPPRARPHRVGALVHAGDRPRRAGRPGLRTRARQHAPLPRGQRRLGRSERRVVPSERRLLPARRADRRGRHGVAARRTAAGARCTATSPSACSPRSSCTSTPRSTRSRSCRSCTTRSSRRWPGWRSSPACSNASRGSSTRPTPSSSDGQRRTPASTT